MHKRQRSFFYTPSNEVPDVDSFSYTPEDEERLQKYVHQLKTEGTPECSSEESSGTSDNHMFDGILTPTGIIAHLKEHNPSILTGPREATVSASMGTSEPKGVKVVGLRTNNQSSPSRSRIGTRKPGK